MRVSAFTPAAWITLLFLYRLPFAADGGERRAGRAAWGMGAEGSWTPINPEKKKFGRAASRMEGLEGATGWRARAAENQEVTAAKRTDVFDRRDMTRAREEEEVAGAGPRAPA